METPGSGASTILGSDDINEKKAYPSYHSHDDGNEVAEPITPKIHDPNAPDLSFPFQSTDIAEGGMTEEYRVVSRTGLIPADKSLIPVPSHHPLQQPGAIRDIEKAKALKDVKLVTFVPNDPEDPRSHARWYKWCTLYFYRDQFPKADITLLDITFVCAMSVVEVAFASAVVTGDFEDIQAEFHVGDVVAALSVTLMVVGFGIGPLLHSPLVSKC
jgi:hypothetical protein